MPSLNDQKITRADERQRASYRRQIRFACIVAPLAGLVIVVLVVVTWLLK